MTGTPACSMFWTMVVALPCLGVIAVQLRKPPIDATLSTPSHAAEEQRLHIRPQIHKNFNVTD